jgi:hypothetical protein
LLDFLQTSHTYNSSTQLFFAQAHKKKSVTSFKRVIVYSPINTATMMEEQEGESDNENHGVTSIISPDKMLKKGLRLAGYKQRRRNRVKKETKIVG